VLAVVAGVLGIMPSAFAHARVVATYPGDGSAVNREVTQVWVRFDDVVSLVPRALTVTTDLGVPINLEAPRLVGGKTIKAFVQDHLAAGHYAVGWRVQADDGHVESGSFTFAVARSQGDAPPGSRAAAPGAGPPLPAGDDPVWPVLVAAGVAVAAGAGAGIAVHRGLQVARRDTSRLPM
jgi:methionine-rich copper-binding protein CopC